MWKLVLQNAKTKHGFYENVRSCWNLDAHNRLSIEYESYSEHKKNKKEYKWTKSPTRSGDAISWDETMLWIGIFIQNHTLCHHLWTSFKHKESIVLYVM